jgi:CheY-like chemotaxis protein
MNDLRVTAVSMAMTGPGATPDGKPGTPATMGTSPIATSASSASTSSPPPTTRQAASAPPHAQNKRILLVDDGADNRMLISLVLKARGYEVETAENGLVGVDAAMTVFDSDKAFGLILMDMNMPVLDGYAATKQLRDSGVAVPIIALTAHAMADARDNCVAAGCTDFVTKPIDVGVLTATIGRYLGKKEAATAAT